MLWSFSLKASLIVLIALLCAGISTVNAEVIPLEFTSPTTPHLYSVFMVSADDGWAVGGGGTIIRWTGTEWIPEFSSATLTPFLLILILGVVFILTKTSSKKLKSPFDAKRNSTLVIQ